MAYKPTTAYKGSLPTGTVRKGNKGKDVKAVQTFLNWCMGLKLATDGVCGSATVSAIKKWQKRYSEAYGLAPDGVFGAQSRSVAKKLIKKYAPKKTTTTKTTTKTGVRREWSNGDHTEWTRRSSTSLTASPAWEVFRC